MIILAWILLALNGAVVVLLGSLLIFLRYFAYGFLCHTDRLDGADVLVVEGWLEEKSLYDVIAEFEGDRYQSVITIGGPIRIGTLLTGHHTLADLAAANLRKLGLAADVIVALPSPNVAKDQTETTAQIFQTWVLSQPQTIRRVNIYSSHIHARRTFFLYRHTLSPAIAVGVIASRHRSYGPSNWWKTSYGFKTVLMELIAYGYVWLQHQRSRLPPPLSAQSNTR